MVASIGLVGFEQVLRKLGRLAETQRQQTGGERIERAGVAGLLRQIETLGANQRVVARQAERLVEQQHAVERATRHAGALRCGHVRKTGSSKCTETALNELQLRQCSPERGDSVQRARSVFFRAIGVRLVDQTRHFDGPLDRLVVMEMQRRHRMDVQALEQLIVQMAGGVR